MMREVISAGGVFVAEDGQMLASDYASAFDSRIYPGRHVPDLCGLVGQAANGASYIMLPVASGAALDARSDGTRPDDGWGVFSGTSDAAPQLAGVCALLLEKNPGLTPSEVKSVLAAAARDVVLGAANPASNANAGAMPAATGVDGATGSGLVDAFAAWRLV
jgi:subtilisin family serine protease